MSLMERLEKIASQGMRPQVSEQQYAEGIHKIANDALVDIAEYQQKDEEMSKQAEEAMDKLSAEEIAEVNSYITYGRGIGYGSEIGKAAGYKMGISDMQKLAYDVATQIFGGENADALLSGIYKAAGIDEEDVQAENEIEQIKNDISEAAAAQLIQAAGGEKQITPEQAEEFRQIAETAGEIGVQKLMEEQGGEDEGPEE